MPPDPIVVVLGGANLDVKARSARPIVSSTSNPGRTVIAPGGVGRNVAEGLARLGTTTHLMAAVGDDVLGELVLAATTAAGVHTSLVRRTRTPTGTYTAVLDRDGELVAAVADMAATDELAPADVDAAVELIGRAALVVLDGNLGLAPLVRALDVAGEAGVRVLLDPVSVPKAAALAPVLEPRRPLFAITPNDDELAAITGHRGDPGVVALHDLGVELVWLRRGSAGSVLSGPDGARTMPVVPADVVDVTGAGDAMLAAFCHFLLTGSPPAEAAALGHAAAALTIAVEQTVRPDLSDELVRSALP